MGSAELPESDTD
uniref:Uncharacterized protein n=2 Tax=Neisseria TaxID=482 RepID=C6SMM7_NEIME|nr:hypothetical protein predicted by Glimmer/Critica [Neisseria meningitidis alpha275]